MECLGNLITNNELFQWTAYGDNGPHGGLVRWRVVVELRLQLGLSLQNSRMGEVPARVARPRSNPAIQQYAIQVNLGIINPLMNAVSSEQLNFPTINEPPPDCTDHSTTGNCASLLTQLAELGNLTLVQQLCEGDGGLGSTLCQRTCHDIFYTYDIVGTFCWWAVWQNIE